MNKEELVQRIALRKREQEVIGKQIEILEQQLEILEGNHISQDVDLCEVTTGFYLSTDLTVRQGSNWSTLDIKSGNCFTNRCYAEMIAYKVKFELNLYRWKEQNDDHVDQERAAKYHAQLDGSDLSVKGVRTQYGLPGVISFSSKALLEDDIATRRAEWIRYLTICEKLC